MYRVFEVDSYDEVAVQTKDSFPMKDYQEGAVLQLACIKCGGREFNVGTGLFGMYLTAVQCVKCKIPCTIHTG